MGLPKNGARNEPEAQSGFPQTFFEQSFNREDARIPGPEIVSPVEWTIDTMTTMIVRLGLSGWISPVGDTILEKKTEKVKEEEVGISRKRRSIEGEPRPMSTGQAYRTNKTSSTGYIMEEKNKLLGLPDNF